MFKKNSWINLQVENERLKAEMDNVKQDDRRKTFWLK